MRHDYVIGIITLTIGHFRVQWQVELVIHTPIILEVQMSGTRRTTAAQPQLPVSITGGFLSGNFPLLPEKRRLEISGFSKAPPCYRCFKLRMTKLFCYPSPRKFHDIPADDWNRQSIERPIQHATTHSDRTKRPDLRETRCHGRENGFSSLGYYGIAADR